MAQHFKPTIDASVLKIMVLETDTPHPDTQTEKGSFGEIVHRHFSDAGKEHHPPLGVETDQVFVVTEKGGKTTPPSPSPQEHADRGPHRPHTQVR